MGRKNKGRVLQNKSPAPERESDVHEKVLSSDEFQTPTHNLGELLTTDEQIQSPRNQEGISDLEQLPEAIDKLDLEDMLASRVSQRYQGGTESPEQALAETILSGQVDTGVLSQGSELAITSLDNVLDRPRVEKLVQIGGYREVDPDEVKEFIVADECHDHALPVEGIGSDDKLEWSRLTLRGLELPRDGRSEDSSGSQHSTHMRQVSGRSTGAISRSSDDCEVVRDNPKSADLPQYSHLDSFFSPTFDNNDTSDSSNGDDSHRQESIYDKMRSFIGWIVESIKSAWKSFCCVFSREKSPRKSDVPLPAKDRSEDRLDSGNSRFWQIFSRTSQSKFEP